MATSRQHDSGRVSAVKERYSTNIPDLHAHTYPTSRSSMDPRSRSPRPPYTPTTRYAEPPPAPMDMRGPIHLPAAAQTHGSPQRLQPAGPVIRPMQQPLGDTAAPPLNHLDKVWGIRDAHGAEITYQIQARIDKGFELAGASQWICYRRNYFSLVGSYHLSHTSNAYQAFKLNGSEVKQAYAFGLGLSAQTDREHPRAVELVQLTTKRDKGPQGNPPVIRLNPQNHGQGPAASFSTADGDMGGLTPPTVANFERIQFKSATQNNGKRRAAQEFYRLKMNFMAQIDAVDRDGRPKIDKDGNQAREWMVIATRMTGPLVVRGRSPGHYREEDAKALASASTRGPEGQSVPPPIMPAYPNPYPPSHTYGQSPGTPGGYLPYQPPTPPYPQTTQQLPPIASSGSAYPAPPVSLPHHEPSQERERERRESVRKLEPPTDPKLTEEEVSEIKKPSGYRYMPFILKDVLAGATKRSPSQDDPMDADAEGKPALATWGGDGRLVEELAGSPCGRFEGFASSVGHFPALKVQV